MNLLNKKWWLSNSLLCNSELGVNLGIGKIQSWSWNAVKMCASPMKSRLDSLVPSKDVKKNLTFLVYLQVQKFLTTDSEEDAYKDIIEDLQSKMPSLKDAAKTFKKGENCL